VYKLPGGPAAGGFIQGSLNPRDGPSNTAFPMGQYRVIDFNIFLCRRGASRVWKRGRSIPPDISMDYSVGKVGKVVDIAISAVGCGRVESCSRVGRWYTPRPTSLSSQLGLFANSPSISSRDELQRPEGCDGERDENHAPAHRRCGATRSAGLHTYIQHTRVARRIHIIAFVRERKEKNTESTVLYCTVLFCRITHLFVLDGVMQNRTGGYERRSRKAGR
jgi:hypothetical protein